MAHCEGLLRFDMPTYSQTQLLPRLQPRMDASLSILPPGFIPTPPPKATRRKQRGKHRKEDKSYSPQYFRLKMLPSHPSGLLCSDCALSIERDTEFWGKKWQNGGKQFIKPIEEHIARYPHFLLSLLGSGKMYIHNLYLGIAYADVWKGTCACYYVPMVCNFG